MIKSVEESKRNVAIQNISKVGGLFGFDSKSHPYSKTQTIFVKGVNGKTMSLPVSDNETIEKIKKMIESKQNIPLVEQRLVFGGKQLEDGKTFTTYNIQSGSTLHLLLRLSGGSTPGDDRLVMILGKHGLKSAINKFSEKGYESISTLEGFDAEDLARDVGLSVKDATKVISTCDFGRALQSVGLGHLLKQFIDAGFDTAQSVSGLNASELGKDVGIDSRDAAKVLAKLEGQSISPRPEFEDFLKEIGMDQYCDALVNAGYLTYVELRSATKSDLQKVGLLAGHANSVVNKLIDFKEPIQIATQREINRKKETKDEDFVTQVNKDTEEEKASDSLLGGLLGGFLGLFKKSTDSRQTDATKQPTTAKQKTTVKIGKTSSEEKTTAIVDKTSSNQATVTKVITNRRPEFEDFLKEIEMDQYFDALVNGGYVTVARLLSATKGDLQQAGLKSRQADSIVKKIEDYKQATQIGTRDTNRDEETKGEGSDAESDSDSESLNYDRQPDEEPEGAKRKSHGVMGAVSDFAGGCRQKIGGVLLPKPVEGVNFVPFVPKQPMTASMTGKQNKTIVIVGQTGSGKTTVINAMMNHLFSVKRKDKYRYKLIDEQSGKNQTHSQTSEVKSYYIEPNEHIFPSGLTIVDTPGFGDTRGLEQDQKICNQIKYFFEKEIIEITAVVLVIKSTENRLTAQQRYIFNSILQILGKNMAPNIVIIYTFTDGGKVNAEDAVREDKIPCVAQVKTNNSAFSEEFIGKMDDLMRASFWKLGMKSFEQFFKVITNLRSTSLQQTREVLKRRQLLEEKIECFRVLVDAGITKLNSLSNLVRQVKQHELDINANKDFSYTEQVPHTVKVDLAPGIHTTLCITCNRTCHNNCGIADDSQKYQCCSMDNGNCKICPSKCHWTQHKNVPYVVEIVMRPEVKNFDIMKSKYYDADSKKSKVKQLIDGIKRDFIDTQVEVIDAITIVRDCVNELQKIALRPNVVGQQEYIKLLIQSEKDEKRPGFVERISQYQSLLTKLDRVSDVMKDNYEPWKEYFDAIENEAQGTDVAGMSQEFVFPRNTM